MLRHIDVFLSLISAARVGSDHTVTFGTSLNYLPSFNLIKDFLLIVLISSTNSECSCLFLFYWWGGGRGGIKLGVINSLLTCVGCPILHQLHWLWSFLLISLGLLASLPIHIAFVTEAEILLGRGDKNISREKGTRGQKSCSRAILGVGIRLLSLLVCPEVIFSSWLKSQVLHCVIYLSWIYLVWKIAAQQLY